MSNNTFNEDTRVKIPALIHLSRLGYNYLSLKENHKIDIETNIFTEIFSKSISKINNKEIDNKELKKIIEELKICLDNEDLGRSFYKKILGDFKYKLIDFDNFENNSFNCVTELTYQNGEEEFRPDITILINGIPLGFIEVKKPNNRDGILAERERINVRFRKKKFRKFTNITQLIVFSNNMEYDTDSIVPVEGAFYATPDYSEVLFNCFREEDKKINQGLRKEDTKIEREILIDLNMIHIKDTNEYITNKQIDTPTNRVLTSLFSQDRIKTLLKYGFAYVEDPKEGLKKHIMRYPQLFATKAIESNLNKGVRKGIIWHTQGSGKTALAYFNIKYLTDYFQKKNTITKFYFIVDRIDLMTQASSEFTNRGLSVDKVNSKDAFIKNIQNTEALEGNIGKQSVTVVNIHKFSEESIAKKSDYAANVQRIYFLDEVHRSYKPRGSFLANLILSDPNAILIGLTGTPLIDKDLGFNSKDIFGNYFHKYYYNSSIADGYTLKLLREGIETKYKEKIEKITKEIEGIKKGSLDKRQVFSHKKFVGAMTDYIVTNFLDSRKILGDNTFGGMVVCDSSDQAKMIFEKLKEYKELKSELVLHDIGDKDYRKDIQENFKIGKIDLLIVFQMLLTGFDAKRLKKLYLARIVREHNLLQTLTRVNRPYKNFKYGYVVDFADIRKEFDKTNQEYLKELEIELGDEIKNYSNIFVSKKEIEEELDLIKNKLFRYDLSNVEEFGKIITALSDKKEILELKRCLLSLKEMYNVIKVFYSDLLEKFDFSKIGSLYREVENRINLINLKESLDDKEKTAQLLNIQFENIEFIFNKISEEEMIIADKYKEKISKAQGELRKCIDKNDPIFITLSEEFKRILRKKKIEELTSEEINKSMHEFEEIFRKMKDQNIRDQQLSIKYDYDYKFTRIHKEMLRKKNINFKGEIQLNSILLDIKKQTDKKIDNNSDIITNEKYFSREAQKIIIDSFEANKIDIDLNEIKGLVKLLTEEYLKDVNEDE